MKNTLLALFLLAGSSHAAITISGVATTGVRNRTGTNVVAGGLALLIVDVAGDGFIGMGNLPLNTTLTHADTPDLSPPSGVTIGSLFLGDLVLNTMTTSGSGAISGLLTNVSVADHVGKNFAVVWFDGNFWFGIIRGADWTLPAADSGTFTFSPTDSNGAASYYQVNSNTPAADGYNFRTATGVGGTSAAAFGIPEPSVALLGALGAIGLFRRRR